MNEIIFKSNKGIVFERITYKNNRCQLIVRNENSDKAIVSYRYKNVPSFQSPYLNWENLNCCAGWSYDKTYLYTAVQEGRKLYSNIIFSIFEEEYVNHHKNYNLHTEKTVNGILTRLASELPDDCIMDYEEADIKEHNFVKRSIFICKKGSLHDYYNLDDVLYSYKQFGVIIGDAEKDAIKQVSSNPLKSFGRSDFIYQYAHARSGPQAIVTGLLLGYPIETTVGVINWNKYFVIEK